MYNTFSILGIAILVIVQIATIIAHLAITSYISTWATALNRRWVLSYTSIAPESLRSARREAKLSEACQFLEQGIGEGRSLDDAGFRLLVRTVTGSIGDISWALGTALGPMPDYLERIASSTNNCRLPALAIAMISAFLLLNAILFSFQEHTNSTVTVTMNCLLVVAAGLIWNLRTPRQIRTVLVSITATALLLPVGYIILLTIHHEFHTSPTFVPLLVELGIAVVPIASALLLCSDTIRLKVFQGRWLPVLIAWVGAVAASVGLAFIYAQNPSALVSMWAATFGGTALLVLLIGLTAYFTDRICHSLLTATSAGMRLLAREMRHMK